jgi:hypothetical protein
LTSEAALNTVGSRYPGMQGCDELKQREQFRN